MAEVEKSLTSLLRAPKSVKPFRGHTGVTSGEHPLINGRLWEGMMMTHKLTQCVSFCVPTAGHSQGGRKSQRHLHVVSRKSRLRHLEAKRCPILAGSCVNKPVTVLKLMQQERNSSRQPQTQLKYEES